MKKSIKKWLKIGVFTIFCIIVICINNIFALTIDEIKEKHNVLKEPNKKLVMVVGNDTINIFCKSSGYKNYCFSKFPTISIIESENIDKMYEALNDRTEYIVLLLGNDDLIMNVSCFDFKEILSEYVKTAKTFGKKVLLHSYIDSPTLKNETYLYTVKDYDDVLKNIAKENTNVRYIDIKKDFIDNKDEKKTKSFYKKIYDILKDKLEKEIIAWEEGK